MKRRSHLKFLIAATTALCVHGAIQAQERASRDEAVAMAKAAVAYAAKHGKDKAMADFNDPASAEWHKKDLYVFAVTMTGDVLAHGINAKLIGKNVIDLKDPSGKLMIQEFRDVAAKSGGWVDYDWPHPQTKKVEAKTSYVIRFSNIDAFVGVGVYR